MKKLKVYKKCDFRLVDATLGTNVCDKMMTTSGYGEGSITKGDGEKDENADEAPLFRDGIWDN